MIAPELLAKIEAQDPETRLIITGISWNDYEKILQDLGDRSSYRITYLDQAIEIMSPSRSHEFIKENIGRLLETYLEIKKIDFWGLGSTTFRKEGLLSGKEPDKCYCIHSEKAFPDLAIEVKLMCILNAH